MKFPLKYTIIIIINILMIVLPIVFKSWLDDSAIWISLIGIALLSFTGLYWALSVRNPYWKVVNAPLKFELIPLNKSSIKLFNNADKTTRDYFHKHHVTKDRINRPETGFGLHTVLLGRTPPERISDTRLVRIWGRRAMGLNLELLSEDDLQKIYYLEGNNGYSTIPDEEKNVSPSWFDLHILNEDFYRMQEECKLYANDIMQRINNNSR